MRLGGYEHLYLVKANMKRFAQLIAGYSIRQLSQMTGLSQSTLRYYQQRGIEHATVANASKLAKLLHTSIEDMTGDARDV